MHDTGFRKKLTADPQAADVFVGAPDLTAVTPKPYHIDVDWSLPSDLQSAISGDPNGSYVSGYQIYRGVNGSQPALYATVSVPGNTFSYSYADTAVQAGQAYCYYITYLLFDACSDMTFTSPPSSTLCAQTCGTGCSSPEVLMTGNQAEMGDSGYSFIQTYDLADGSFLFQFIPGGTQTDEPNGRGLAVSGSEIFYSEVPQNSWGPWGAPGNWIHVCPYGTEGSGGGDLKTILNPDTRSEANGYSAWISSVTFHYDANKQKNELYLLTGYGLGENSDGTFNYPEVWEVDPDSPDGTVTTIAGPTTIATPEDPADLNFPYSSSDGFAVLPNGDFLVNDYDGGDGCTTYREYYGFGAPPNLIGTLVQTGLVVNLQAMKIPNLNSGIAGGMGVTVAPDGGSLYFVAALSNQGEILIQTNFNNGQITCQPVSGSDQIENIGVTVIQ